MKGAMAAATQADEIDALSSLEQRITRAVELVVELRAEKQALQAELDRAIAERDAARIEVKSAQTSAAAVQAELNGIKSKGQRSTQELDELRAERKQVRARIEKLLTQMDLLGSE